MVKTEMPNRRTEKNIAVGKDSNDGSHTKETAD